jgi:hypothetical protein
VYLCEFVGVYLCEFVGVYLCKFYTDNRSGYSGVISWSISMASSESAVWLGLEHGGWSIPGLGGYCPSCITSVVVLCDPSMHQWLWKGLNDEVCTVLSLA